MKTHMAVSNHGNTLHDIGPHPRKGLLKALDRKSASKVYIDKLDGTTIHVGYIVAGQWWTVYKVEPMERPA